MSPTLSNGSRVNVRFSQDVTTGDVVVVRSTGRFIAHRVVGSWRDACGVRWLRTRGDANLLSDHEFKVSAVVGIVTEVDARTLRPLGRIRRAFTVSSTLLKLGWRAVART